MDSPDPVATRYRNLGKDRREFRDPSYRGPERRLEQRRKIAIEKIIKKLEKELPVA
jgi:hypothetical protein